MKLGRIKAAIATKAILPLKHFLLGDKRMIEQRWKLVFKRPIDLKNPKTMNEKIQWLKLYDRKPIYSIWADKFGSREYIEKHFGSEYLVPLLFETTKPSEINPQNINTFPCVIKANHSSGDYMFLKDANIDWKALRKKCRSWLRHNFYLESQEWQYKSIKRRIIVEKMLVGSNGKIPNDYKLHFIEGKLAFVYCSIDREGENQRQIFDPEWHLLPFTWDGAGVEPKSDRIPIERPVTFPTMLKIGQHFADQMHYVRVDFYEVDGHLYCGEITLHHGSGIDKFAPAQYDEYYGSMLKVPF